MEQLKEVSQAWDEKTWHRFLDSTDGSIEGLQLISAKRLSYKTAYMTQTIFDLWVEGSSPENIQQIVQLGLMKLTSRQRQVVEAICFEGLSIEGAASSLGITKSTAFAHLQKALMNLKRPMELMERLVALVPRPRVHLTRYHGVLGPHYKHRKQIVPKSPELNVVPSSHGFLNL